MKELSKIDTPDTDKVVIEQAIIKHVVFIGTQKKIKGLTMFEFDPIKMTLKPAEFKETTAVIGKSIDETKIRHELIFKEGCAYVQAINKRNAYKKIAKRIANNKNK